MDTQPNHPSKAPPSPEAPPDTGRAAGSVSHQPKFADRHPIWMIVVGFLFSNLLGGAVTLWADRQLETTKAENALREKRRVESQSVLEKVSRDLDREGYLLGRINQEIARQDGSPEAIDSLRRVFEAQSPEATGEVSLRAAEICDYFGVDARADYLRLREARREQMRMRLALVGHAMRVFPSPEDERTERAKLADALSPRRTPLAPIFTSDSATQANTAAFVARLKQRQSRVNLAPDTTCVK